MATTKTAYPTIGGVWAALLDLWVRFAQGEFTSWAYTMTTLSTYYAVKVTVGLSGGGTDDYYLGAMETVSSDFCTVKQIFESAGWRTLPQVVLPPTVPGGTATDVSYLNGPIAFRKDVPLYWANANTGSANDYTKTGPDGVSFFFNTFLVWRQNIVFVDVIGMMFGTLSGVDAFAALPTDFIGNAPIVMSSGGGSVDLSGVEEALLDIATADVDYTFNQEGVIYTMRGMVRAGG